MTCASRTTTDGGRVTCWRSLAASVPVAGPVMLSCGTVAVPDRARGAAKGGGHPAGPVAAL